MKILAIEDNQDILDNLFEFLEAKGHVVDAAHDGLSGLHLAATEHYDAIVLDLMLPALGGVELCRKLREQGRIDIPVLMLTARDTLEDKLEGFRAGADDYLVKPFSLPELEARLAALIRRRRGAANRRILRVADLSFDTETLEVRRGETKIELNPTTRSILLLLMQESPRVVSKRRLEYEIWSDDVPDGDALRSHIYHLRTAIDRPFEKKLLKTLPKEGYVLSE